MTNVPDTDSEQQPRPPQNYLRKPNRVTGFLDQHRKLSIGLIIAVALALIITGGALNKNSAGGGVSAGSNTDTFSSRSHEVTYRLEGTTNQASITYSTPNGGTEQQQDVDVPLKTKIGTLGIIQTFSPGSFVYISAQNSNEYGSITCVIEVDGVVTVTNTSTGAYVIATCDGRL